MLREAIVYVLAADRRQFVIGSLLALFSPLLVPLCALAGYWMRVLEKPGATPPAFDEWKEMVIDGGKFLVIAGSWFFTPLVFVALFYGIAFHHHLGEGGPRMTFIALFYYGSYFYSMPAIAGRFARTRQMKEAFNLPVIAPVWMEPEYRIRAIAGIGAIFVGIIVTTVFVGVTGGLGVVLVPAIVFWVGVALVRLYADGIDSVTRLG